MSTEPAGLPDFSRSFLTFSVPEGRNTARIQIDSRCGVSGAGDEEFVLITPCKSEVMYVEAGLFADPNYDFCGVFSRNEYLLLRTWPKHDPANAGEWDAGANADRFADVRIDVTQLDEGRTRRLHTSEEVVEATLSGLPILARTRLRSPAGDLEAVVDYAVKTMNVRQKTGDFQVDTGPILVPAWLRDDAPISRGSRKVEGFDMAFACYNTFDRAEFVVREPAPSGSGKVWHYSRIVTSRAEHELFAVAPG